MKYKAIDRDYDGEMGVKARFRDKWSDWVAGTLEHLSENAGFPFLDEYRNPWEYCEILVEDEVAKKASLKHYSDMSVQELIIALFTKCANLEKELKELKEQENE
jgi:hypothetical protein